MISRNKAERLASAAPLPLCDESYVETEQALPGWSRPSVALLSVACLPGPAQGKWVGDRLCSNPCHLFPG